MNEHGKTNLNKFQYWSITTTIQYNAIPKYKKIIIKEEEDNSNIQINVIVKKLWCYKFKSIKCLVNENIKFVPHSLSICNCHEIKFIGTKGKWFCLRGECQPLL